MCIKVTGAESMSRCYPFEDNKLSAKVISALRKFSVHSQMDLWVTLKEILKLQPSTDLGSHLPNQP
jgi:hypothetical protein